MAGAFFLLVLVLVRLPPPDDFPDNAAAFLAELALFRDEVVDPFPSGREDFFDELPRAFFAGMCFSSSGMIAKYRIPWSDSSNVYAISKLPGSLDVVLVIAPVSTLFGN